MAWGNEAIAHVYVSYRDETPSVHAHVGHTGHLPSSAARGVYADSAPGLTLFLHATQHR